MENEKLDIQVGDRVTYKYYDNFSKQIIEKTILINENKIVFSDNIEILKIERPHYEEVEKKKKLLTEEEKEFLRIFNKIEKNKIKEVEINTLGELCITNNFTFTNYIHTNKFQNLEKNKKYTLKELGLEEN